MIESAVLDPAVSAIHADYRRQFSKCPTEGELITRLRSEFKMLVKPQHLRASLARQNLKPETVEVGGDLRGAARLVAARRQDYGEPAPPELTAEQISRLSPVAKLAYSKREGRRIKSRSD